MFIYDVFFIGDFHVKTTLLQIAENSVTQAYCDMDVTANIVNQDLRYRIFKR
jgi:hypothetical protein